MEQNKSTVSMDNSLNSSNNIKYGSNKSNKITYLAIILLLVSFILNIYLFSTNLKSQDKDKLLSDNNVTVKEETTPLCNNEISREITAYFKKPMGIGNEYPIYDKKFYIKRTAIT
jgi:hypothetical protein